MEDMGFKISGFAFGRADEWIPEEVNWGPEGQWLTDKRRDQQGKLHGTQPHHARRPGQCAAQQAAEKAAKAAGAKK
mgnify:CR=1 FL=1